MKKVISLISEQTEATHEEIERMLESFLKRLRSRSESLLKKGSDKAELATQEYYSVVYMTSLIENILSDEELSEAIDGIREVRESKRLRMN
jgi:hypothetical protein